MYNAPLDLEALLAGRLLASQVFRRFADLGGCMLGAEIETV
jgi:hypothetical protein